MPRTLGIITIGQAPRDDIASLFAQHAPAGTKVVLRGAFDGLSDAQVDALKPESGADTLYTRLRGDGKGGGRSQKRPANRVTQPHAARADVGGRGVGLNAHGSPRKTLGIGGCSIEHNAHYRTLALAVSVIWIGHCLSPWPCPWRP